MGYEFKRCKNFDDMSRKEMLETLKTLSRENDDLSYEVEITNRVCETIKLSLENERKNVDKLMVMLKELQPKEVQDELNTCQRGEWCYACIYHQTVDPRHGAGFSSQIKSVDICMKGLACKSFLNKCERED